MTSLFSSFTLRGVTFPNRIAISPMSQYRARDGYVNDWHMVHLGRFALGGAGLVYAEASVRRLPANAIESAIKNGTTRSATSRRRTPRRARLDACPGHGGHRSLAWPLPLGRTGPGQR